MGEFTLYSFARIHVASPTMIMLWIGLAVFTLALVVLMWTRWGQYRPLRKCLVLSLLAHALFIGYATTVNIVLDVPHSSEQIAHVLLDDAAVDDQPAAEPDQAPWERLAVDPVSPPPAPEPERTPTPDSAEAQRTPTSDEALAAPVPANLDHVALNEMARIESMPPADAEPRNASAKGAEAIETPQAARRDAETVLPPAPALARQTADENPLQPASRETAAAPSPLGTLGPLPRINAPTSADEAGEALAAVAERIEAAQAAESQSFSPVAQPTSPPYGTAAAVPRSRLAPIDPSLLTPPVTGGAVQAAPSSEALAAAASAGSATPKEADQGSDAADGSRATRPNLPEAYSLRVAPNRDQVVERHGGNSETETAVKAALAWLAKSQSPDGRWDASEYGAGRDDQVLGQNRHDAGIEADTGVTGLALLAFLGSGHTHHDSQYAANVRRGLDFLIRSQAADGNLSGNADPFARMYCHGMATLALSEAYGMTGDAELREPVRRAIDYTIAAQHPGTGGWRYLPSEPGDTSQLGWQLMALKSAEMAGIVTPEVCRQRTIHFLQSVSSGDAGGLASYRPGERPSRAMTAEALFCWEMLGLSREHPACGEAADFLLAELPGSSRHNCYYWYYATLSLYQLQNDAWQKWNAAMQPALIQAQRTDGDAAGSWDPTTLWGGYGGRVYTTAISTLTLEVYYRYLPLYGMHLAEQPRVQR